MGLGPCAHGPRPRAVSLVAESPRLEWQEQGAERFALDAGQAHRQLGHPRRAFGREVSDLVKRLHRERLILSESLVLAAARPVGVEHHQPLLLRGVASAGRTVPVRGRRGSAVRCAAGEHVECESCAGTFDMEALNHDPAAERAEMPGCAVWCVSGKLLRARRDAEFRRNQIHSAF